jgi:hypothetical protein
MIAISAALLILLEGVYTQQQQVRVLQRKSPRPTKSVQVYATMLLEHTADNMETLPTTTLDAGLMNDNQKEGGDETGDEAGPGEQNEEGFTDRTRTASSTIRTTEMDPSLIDEFIFTTKAPMTKQNSSATQISVSAAMLAVVLLFFIL